MIFLRNLKNIHEIFGIESINHVQFFSLCQRCPDMGLHLACHQIAADPGTPDSVLIVTGASIRPARRLQHIGRSWRRFTKGDDSPDHECQKHWRCHCQPSSASHRDFPQSRSSERGDQPSYRKPSITISRIEPEPYFALSQRRSRN